MKHLLAVLLPISMFFASCDKTTEPEPEKFTISSPDAVTGAARDADIEAHAMLKNITSETITIRWTKTDDNLVSGWETAVCDILCYPPIELTRTYELTPNQEVDLKFHFYPNEMPGVGSSKLKIQLEGKPDTEKVVTFNCTVSE